MLPWLHPGLAPASLHDSRLGQTLDALYDATLSTVCSAMALRALDRYRMSTPWRHQDTTTISFSGAYEDDEAGHKGPRPTYGSSKEGRGDLTQVMLSVGGSGDGGLPLRMGLHDGNRSDTVDIPQAIAQRVALGFDGLRGIVADSKAYTPRPLGLCRETGMGLVTLVPRSCAMRQEGEAWGHRRVSLPLLREKPGKRRSDAPRRWYGRRVTRHVEIEERAGQITVAPMRFVAVYSTQLAQRHAEAYARQQEQEAQSLATHIAQVHCRQCACHADAEEAIAVYEGRGSGRRGRPATRWRSHASSDEVESRRQRHKRPQRGRPRTGEEPHEEIVSQRKVTSQAMAAPVATCGWLVLATTLEESICSDAEMVRAYRDQTRTGERGFRWMKHPAAMHPVWLEKRERIAALAMLTVVGLLVYGLMQRQVRQYFQEYEETIPGKKGETNTPTATVVFESFATLNRVALNIDGGRGEQFSGWQVHHERVFQALGLSPLINADLATQKKDLGMPKGP